MINNNFMPTINKQQFIVSIYTKHNGRDQLRQMLTDESRARYINAFSVEDYRSPREIEIEIKALLFTAKKHLKEYNKAYKKKLTEEEQEDIEFFGENEYNRGKVETYKYIAEELEKVLIKFNL